MRRGVRRIERCRMTGQEQLRRTQFSVVSLGDLVVDLVFEIPRLPLLPEEVQVAQGPRLEPGGSGNFLIAGSRLGLAMYAQGSMGDDTYGRSAAQILVEEGVDVTGVVHAPGSTSTLVLVLVDAAGQHTFLGCYGIGPKLPLSNLWRQQISKASVFFTNVYAFVEPQICDATPEAIEAACQAGVPIFIDLGPNTSSMSEEARRSLGRQSTVTIGTEKEMLMAMGTVDIGAAAAALLERGTSVVVVKRGERGCQVYTRDEMLELPGFSVPLRDSTAAGDTFAAAFVYAYLYGYSLRDTATFANAVAAVKVQKVGSGRQVPTAQEVMDFLRTHDVDLPFPALWETEDHASAS